MATGKKESKLQRDIAKAMRDHGAWVAKYHGGPHGHAGVPDLLACYRGYFIGFEVKTPENKSGPTELQEKQIAKIKEAGGAAGVVRSVEQAMSLLYAIDKKLGGLPA